MARQYRRLVGTLGDSDPLEHFGGLILKHNSNYTEIVYFEPFPELKDGVQKWWVYSTDTDPYYADWADLKAVASTNGIEFSELKEMGESKDPVKNAYFLEAIAQYYGWGELDPYCRVLTKTQINKEFYRWV